MTDGRAVTDAQFGVAGMLVDALAAHGVRFGDAPMVVEQCADATGGPSARISRIRLLCSGSWNEHAAV